MSCPAEDSRRSGRALQQPMHQRASRWVPQDQRFLRQSVADTVRSQLDLGRSQRPGSHDRAATKWQRQHIGHPEIGRDPTISTAYADSLETIDDHAEVCARAPHVSYRNASVIPVRNAAPRIELAGPEPIVRIGNRAANSRSIKVPSF